MKELILKCKYPGEFETLGTLTKGSIYIGKTGDISDKLYTIIDDQGNEVKHKATRFGVVAEATGVAIKNDPEPTPKSERQKAEDDLVTKTVYVTTDSKKFDDKETAIGYQVCLNIYEDWQ